MSEIQSMNTPEKNALIDDNARKFIVLGTDHQFFEAQGALSYELVTDWLETNQDNESKVVCKRFENGDIQRLLIAKVTIGDKRTSEKKKITKFEYDELRESSTLHLKKMRHEFDYVQNGVIFSMKFDEFSDSELSILEVDAQSEAERSIFNPRDFQAKLEEVTGDVSYYGYRVADIA